MRRADSKVSRHRDLGHRRLSLWLTKVQKDNLGRFICRFGDEMLHFLRHSVNCRLGQAAALHRLIHRFHFFLPQLDTD
jgi:hypothetical protein